MEESYSICINSGRTVGVFLEWWCIPNAHVHILKLKSSHAPKLSSSKAIKHQSYQALKLQTYMKIKTCTDLDAALAPPLTSSLLINIGILT